MTAKCQFPWRSDAWLCVGPHTWCNLLTEHQIIDCVNVLSSTWCARSVTACSCISVVLVSRILLIRLFRLRKCHPFCGNSILTFWHHGLSVHASYVLKSNLYCKASYLCRYFMLSSGSVSVVELVYKECDICRGREIHRYVCQKLSTENMVWQSYWENKRVQFFAPQGCCFSLVTNIRQFTIERKSKSMKDSPNTAK